MEYQRTHLSDDQNSPSAPPGALGTLWAVLAWVLIILVSVTWISQDLLLEALLVDEPEIGEVVTNEAQDHELLVTMQDDVLGKFLVGFDVAFPTSISTNIVDAQAAELRSGNSGQRLAWVVLQARFNGIASGREALEEVIAEDSENPTPQSVVALIEKSFAAAEDGEELSKNTQIQLKETLGYFGKVAISLSDKTVAEEINHAAVLVLIALLTLLGIFGFMGFAGFVGLIIMIVMACVGKVHAKVNGGPGHGVYAETFALWLVMFFGLQILLGMSKIEPALLMATLAFFLSLSALAWPVIRGKTWSQVRNDIGWRSGRSAVIEPVYGGLATWSMALPLMGLGLLLTFILSVIIEQITGTAPVPSHPIQNEAMGAGALQIVLLYLVASVAAPIVEETMFRGVLYQHLRGATRTWARWVSILFAILVSSTVFAAIHPQGLVFMPPLMGLAAGFCIGREWRGSLIGPMVAHGLHNGLVMTLNVFLMM